MAGRVLKVLEDEGLVSASGKTIVVYNVRPQPKIRAVPAAPAATATGQ
jgi:CRP/FNR family cyclic AMP-dependent transcriptional regulator